MTKLLVADSNRDVEWLENKLSDIWYKYFIDVEQKNTVVIRYGRKAKRRLGSIGLDKIDPTVTIITINPIYQDQSIPEYVIDGTIIHEMTHYAHGFNSPHNQRHKYPHSGGVIKREFAERGLESLYIKQQKWLKDHWLTILKKYYKDLHYPRYSKSTKRKIKQPWWIRLA